MRSFFPLPLMRIVLLVKSISLNAIDIIQSTGCRWHRVIQKLLYRAPAVLWAIVSSGLYQANKKFHQHLNRLVIFYRVAVVVI